MNDIIATTKNGIDIYVDLMNSHFATHNANTPGLYEMVQEILTNYVLPELPRVKFETDMGKVLGTMDLVETTPSDHIIYAKRPNREKYTRFVLDRERVPTTFITIEIRRSDEGSYYLYTAYVGPNTPSIPSGPEDTNQENRIFWSNHALVFGKQEIVPGSETTQCPW